MNIADWKKLPPEVQAIFKKYRIISEQDREIGGKSVRTMEYTTAYLQRARDTEGRILGKGHLMNLDVVEKLVKTDTSPRYQWLDWMLFQVGGGQEALRRSEQAGDQVHQRFIEERVRGYRDMSGRWHEPISQEQAEQKWQLTHSRFNTVLNVSDQDIVEKLRVFGFYRHWPGGPNKLYENCIKAVSSFLALLPKTCEMNDFMAKQGMRDKLIKIDSKDYATVEMLQSAVSKIERFFAALAARKDIQVEKIYEDDFLSVICPLTYAAAVRYGWDGWQFSNRNAFENNLEKSNSSWQDSWRDMTGTQGKFVVYIQFHLPMPSWVSYEKDKFTRYTLQNLAIPIEKKSVKKLDLSNSVVFDEENRPNQGLESVRSQIVHEPTRDDDPANEEYPVLRGPRVFQTKESAQQVVDHLNTAISRIEEWAASFDCKRVVSDYMPK
jgi:hypothetical protein